MVTKQDKLFMQLAKEASRAGTCLRLQVGSILVKDQRVISIGYNGAPIGITNCLEVGCDMTIIDGKLHCQRAVHGDQNALTNLARLSGGAHGATLYTTHSPCYACAKMLVNAGVARVIYQNEYDDVKTVQLFKEAKIERVRFQD